MCLFQCEVCHFMNIESRDPGRGGRDDKVLRYIRRANLDAFWARKSSTMYTHFLEIRSVIKDEGKMGMTSPLPEMGYMVLEDISGMGVAVLILKKYLNSGMYNKKHLKCGSIRKRI